MKRISENQKVTLTLGQLKKLIKEATAKKFTELNTKERCDLLKTFLTSLGKFTGYTNNQYREWLDKQGFDTSDLSDKEFNEIVDGVILAACGIEDDETENDSVEIDVDSIETKSFA